MDNSAVYRWIVGVNMFRGRIKAVACAFFSLCCVNAMAVSNASQDLNKLFGQYFEEFLKFEPVYATFIGDNRFNDQYFNSLSPDSIAKRKAFEKRWLTRIKSINREKLVGQDRLSYDVFVYDREVTLEGFQYPKKLIPTDDFVNSLDQFNSFANFTAMLGSGNSFQPFKSTEDYDNWIRRVDAIVVVFDQASTNMRRGIGLGIVQPRPIVEKILPQLSAHLVDKVDDSVFMGPVNNFPETVNDKDQVRLKDAYRTMIQTKLIPAYRRLHGFLEQEYLPASRETVGWSSLPNGTDWYNHQIKKHTTIDMTAEKIHEIGLSEVALIRAEMTKVMHDAGFKGSLKDFFAHLKSSDEFYYDSEEDLLNGYRNLKEKINQALPTLFDIFPKFDYEVRAVEAYRAASAAGAYYNSGTPDGSRPAIFYINTHNLRAQPKYAMETLSIHEASPGHHFQSSIQDEMENLPKFRRFGFNTAFMEGWALYAESIGKEMGMFSDPYQYFGSLSDEMLRAMRLVVDTGLHAKGWNRDKAIQYMTDNSDMADTSIVTEVERYIAWPGQALAYKVGERVIRGLRTEAEKELGTHFDVKAFHRQILLDGAMPMEVLTRKVHEWIASEKSRIAKQTTAGSILDRKARTLALERLATLETDSRYLGISQK